MNKKFTLSLAIITCSLAVLLGCSSTPENASSNGKESFISILKQGIAVGKTGSNIIKAVDNQCQQQLKNNPQYKNKLSALGGSYTQRKLRYNICDSVTDMAMDSISDEQLEKAVNNPNYQHQLINHAINSYLPVSYNKVVNKQ